MPAIMKVLGWRSQGLRCPDHNVDCQITDGVTHKVTLVQMPNGTGKTTTLTLLRAALSGAPLVEQWDQHKIGEFQKREGGALKTGLFEVRLLLNGKRVTIILIFDFERGVVSFKTTQGSGQRNGFGPPSAFGRFLNPTFVNFFVFDGELAQRLLDRSQTNAEAAVETLFQVNTFTTLRQRVKDYWTNQTENQSATEERGRARRSNRVALLEARLAELRKKKREQEQKKADLAGRLKAQQEGYNHEIKKDEALNENIQRALVKLEQLKATVKEEALVVLDSMRDPYAISSKFAVAIADLKKGLDKVKLPDSAAREFFSELANEAECVCGRPIDDHIREAIHTRAAMYLASDDVLFLNSMKTAISDAVGESSTSSEEALCTKLLKLETCVDEERDLVNALDTLQLEAEQSDPAVKRAKEMIDQLKGELLIVEEALEKFESKDQSQNDENTFGIEVLAKRLKDAERKLADITQTITLKLKRDVLVRILEAAHVQARKAITTEVCEETNERISALMPHNDISIERIDRSLVLKNQEGGSVGETLSIAYAFLSTLFNRSEHQLPFVVDSPAGPIDLAVRPKIADLIPRLTGQFIAFTISSERESFTPRLKAACGKDLQFLTIFRKGASGLQRAARAAQRSEETDDGFLVFGEEFFNNFQIESESI